MEIVAEMPSSLVHVRLGGLKPGDREATLLAGCQVKVPCDGRGDVVSTASTLPLARGLTEFNRYLQVWITIRAPSRAVEYKNDAASRGEEPFRQPQ